MSDYGPAIQRQMERVRPRPYSFEAFQDRRLRKARRSRVKAAGLGLLVGALVVVSVIVNAIILPLGVYWGGMGDRSTRGRAISILRCRCSRGRARDGHWPLDRPPHVPTATVLFLSFKDCGVPR